MMSKVCGRALLCLTIASATLAACRDAPTAPASEPVHLSPADAPNKMETVDDPCWTQPWGMCHDWGNYWTTNNYYGFSSASSWDNYDCNSSGCTTYPLGTLTRAKVLFQLENRIRADGDCQAVKSWLMGKVSDGKVRFYPQNDNNYGDIHYIGGYTYGIHLQGGLFVDGQEYQLGMTLMHEGFHGYYDYHDDETAPENFARSCVLTS